MTTETKRQTSDLILQAGPSPNGLEATPRPDAQAVFFFDGDFRTWPQVEHRAKLNGAISSYIARSRWN